MYCQCVYATRSFKWVESPLHGKGGPRWVEVFLSVKFFVVFFTHSPSLQDNIEAYITVAGTHLVSPNPFKSKHGACILKTAPREL
jgi:hypothetical protein